MEPTSMSLRIPSLPDFEPAGNGIGVDPEGETAFFCGPHHTMCWRLNATTGIPTAKNVDLRFFCMTVCSKKLSKI